MKKRIVTVEEQKAAQEKAWACQNEPGAPLFPFIGVFWGSHLEEYTEIIYNPLEKWCIARKNELAHFLYGLAVKLDRTIDYE